MDYTHFKQPSDEKLLLLDISSGRSRGNHFEVFLLRIIVVVMCISTYFCQYSCR